MRQQSPYAPSELRETPFALWSPGGLPPVARRAKGGGEGGIRTPDRLAPMPHFECGAFDHSATSPGAKAGDSSSAVGASSRRGWRARQGTEPRFPKGPWPAKKSHKMEHLTVSASGAAFHVAPTGIGKP